MTRRYCHGPNACSSSDHDVRQGGLVFMVLESSSTIRRLNAKRRGSTCAIGWPSRLDSSPTDVFCWQQHRTKPLRRSECRPSLLVGCLLTRRVRNKKIRVLGPSACRLHHQNVSDQPLAPKSSTTTFHCHDLILRRSSDRI